jgi:hypothetical protein
MAFAMFAERWFFFSVTLSYDDDDDSAAQAKLAR